MPVNTPHKSYTLNESKWTRARACFEGSDAVKAGGAKYLPLLASHRKDIHRYDEYKLRALFYNATGRTVEGLAGFVFQKAPVFDVPKMYEDHLKDITYTGVDAITFALTIARELLLTGRYGVLIDMVDKGGDRPYWIGYRAEDIISWRTERRGDDPSVLVRVVLREFEEVVDPKDPFKVIDEERHRVLELTDKGYRQTKWRKNSKEEWSQFGSIVPLRRGKPLPFIPFQFIGPTSLAVDVQKPPLLDMVDVNLSHYRTMADLEHGRHFTALPTPWVAGARQAGQTLSIGSGKAWDLEKDGRAGMLEFTGAGLSALVTAEQEKRKMMAVLGARLLEDQASTIETATAVKMRHSGEGATLRTMTNVLEQALVIILRWHIWWVSTEEKPEDVKATVELNKDFFTIRLGPQEIQAQLGLLQAEAISYETFYHNLLTGGWTRPDVDSKEERDTIMREGGGTRDDEIDDSGEGGEDGEDDEDVEVKDAGPGIEKGDVVLEDEGPYKLVKRKGQFCVINAETGKNSGCHPTRKLAKKQLAALVINVKD